MIVLFGALGYSVPVVFFVTALITWLINYYWNRRYLYKFSWKAKGPFAWPFFGNLFSFWGSPEHITNFLKKVHNSYGSPTVFWFGQVLTYYVKEPEEALIMLNHPNCILKGYNYKPFKWMFGESQWTTTNVEKWRMKRKLTAPLFNNKMMEIYALILERRSKIFVKKLEHYASNGEFDIFEEYIDHALNQITEASIGQNMKTLNPQVMKNYRKNVKRGREFISERLFKPLYRVDFILYLTKFYRDGEKVFNEIRSFVMSMLNEKKLDRINKSEKPTNDVDDEFHIKRKSFLDQLLDANEEGDKLSDQECMEEVILFTLAATDTSAYTNARVATMLGMFPELQEKIYEEVISIVGDKPIKKEHVEQMEYLDRFIKETIRLFPVGNLLGRHCIEDVDLGTRIVPKGTDLAINMIEYMRDPRRWPDPLKFDPDRFLPEEVAKRHPYSWVGYSAGIRICVGYKFGALSLLLTTANLVRTYKLKTKFKKITDLKVGMDMVCKSPIGHFVEIEFRNPKEISL